jgi:hypothetical protein
MKKTVLALLIVVPLSAQEIKLPPNIEKLADKAREVVDVTMDGSLLQLASRFLSGRDADEARVKKLIAGLKGVYVKSYQFDSRGEYDEKDLDPVRAQLKTPGWSKIVGVKDRRNNENAEVYIKSDASGIVGLAVIAAEAKELTIVQIVGSIQPEDLRDLGGHFGVPRMDFGRKDKED